MTGISMGLNSLIIAVFIFAGIFECRRLFEKHPDFELETVLKKAPYLYVLIPVGFIPLIISIPMRIPSFAWQAPFWFKLHFTAILWGSIISIFSFVFSLGSSICFRSRHKEKSKVAAAGIFLVIGIQIIQYNYTRPIASKLHESVTPSGHIMQTSGSSCAAASAAIIAGSFGIEKTEKEMAVLFGTSVFGTSDAQVIYGMRKTGFSCKKVEIPNADPEKLNTPAMLFIDHPMTGPESHAVVCMGFRDGKAEIRDPLHYDIRFQSKEELAKVWHGRGIEFGRAIIKNQAGSQWRWARNRNL